LFRLEDKLAPRSDAAAPWARDLAGVGLLILMALVLVPALRTDSERYLVDVAGQLGSIYLLVSLGFLLALRCGAIDLSVWAASFLGGLVAARLINAGAPAAWALAAGTGAGMLLGAVNGLLVAYGRLPSVLVTLVTAGVTVSVLSAAFPGRLVSVPDGAFARWHITQSFDAGDLGEQDEGQPPVPVGRGGARQVVSLPLIVTRMLLVAGAYTVAMVVLLVVSRRTTWDRRASLLVALSASGTLSAAGGVFWLIDHGNTPVPTDFRIVDDLRIPAAAVFAGGLFLAGRGRGLLSAACLPAGVFLASIWRVRGWRVTLGGYDLDMLLLAGMVLVAHRAAGAVIASGGRDRCWTIPGAVLTALGVLVMVGSARAIDYHSRRPLLWTGLSIWAAGALVMLLWRTRARWGPLVARIVRPTGRDAG
jgi:ribose/xylose/arabinose/galactoside ABC-type transport system permease subunit